MKKKIHSAFVFSVNYLNFGVLFTNYNYFKSNLKIVKSMYINLEGENGRVRWNHMQVPQIRGNSKFESLTKRLTILAPNYMSPLYRLFMKTSPKG